MAVVSITRYVDGALASADAATVSIVNSAGVVVIVPTAVTPTSAGVYRYETSVLPAGNYTATWVFSVTGIPDETVSRAFSIDSPIELSEGVTLMDIERDVAQRIGPYRRMRCGVGSTVNSVYAVRLKSSLNMGSYEDMHLLRRGLTYGDELVSNFNSEDRVRQIDTYTAALGTLVPDREYAVAPIVDEAFELHALDPEEELRLAVQEGLKRCFFWDTVTVSVTGTSIYNLDLTASAPWLTEVNQVREVTHSYPSQIMPPQRVQWWEPYRSGKTLRLRTQGGGVGTVNLLVLRPVHTLVNGEMSLSGPNDDMDILYVDKDYATAAGVIECWKRFPEILTPLATQNMRASRADYAAIFTTKSMTVVQQVPEKMQIDYGRPDLVQVGNLAEPFD